MHEVQDVVTRLENPEGIAGREGPRRLSPVRGTAGEPETATDRTRAKTLRGEALVERVEGGDGERVDVLRRLEPVECDLDLLPPEGRERQVLEGELRAGAFEQPRPARAGLPRVETGEGPQVSDRPRRDQRVRLVHVAEQPGIDRRTLELRGANRSVRAPGRVPVAVEEAEDGRRARVERGKLVDGERARRYPGLGEGPPEHLHAPAVAPGDVQDLPRPAPPEQPEAGNRVGEAGEDLDVVVPAHREHRDPGRGQPVDPAAQVAVGLVEVVLLLDDVAREQHRVDLVGEGEVDGEPPRRGRPEFARLDLVEEPRGQARGLPAEMDVTDAKKLHDLRPSCSGQGASMSCSVSGENRARVAPPPRRPGRVPDLASRVLRLSLRRPSANIETMHGYPALVAESFLDVSRFADTCYRALNWRSPELTRGFAHEPGGAAQWRHHGKPKEVFMFELSRGLRNMTSQIVQNMVR